MKQSRILIIALKNSNRLYLYLKIMVKTKITETVGVGETFFSDIKYEFIINMLSCMVIRKAHICVYKVYIPTYVSLKVANNTKYKIL